MYANYHTHTWRCRHAAGTEQEYIKQAIHSGIRILGFADHGPYPFPGDYRSDFRMDLDQTADYFRYLLNLKEEYSSLIQLHIGVEVEYYPKLHREMIHFLEEYPCEYLILGQHFLGEESQKRYSSQPHNDPDDLTCYVNQVLEGLSTGCFSCLAHPDLINWQGDPALYREQMRRLCAGAKALNIPLEFNLLGLHEKRHYPLLPFWQIAGEIGNTVILGCDAHKPEDLDRLYEEQIAYQLLHTCGLTPLATLPFKSSPYVD